jgi:phospholipid-binding lipoprotein MlaA
MEYTLGNEHAVFLRGIFMVFGLKRIAMFVAVGALLSGCSSSQNGEVGDPLEPMNRGIFKFNDVVDTALMKPVAEGYRTAVPKPARLGVRNALRNLKSPTLVANDLLQGNVVSACDGVTRFFANTLFGLGGTIDVAGAEGVLYKEEDFGQTLGAWGVDHGAYIVLPFFGPSSVRDTTGLAVDTYSDPVGLWIGNTDRDGLFIARTAVSAVSKREELLDILADLKKNSIDYYSAMKSTYVQRREALVTNNGQNGDVSEMP